MSRLKTVSVKEFEFNRPDSHCINITVPKDLNQSLLKSAKLNEYGVYLVATGRDVLEYEICTLKHGNSTVGFLIPGQAILSQDHPNNSDPIFATYSLIAANTVCTDSKNNNYSLANPEYTSAISKNEIFAQNVFYAVIWLQRLNISHTDFFQNYFVSLAKNGIFRSSYAKASNTSIKTLPSYNTSINLSKNKLWPNYIETICGTLSPYANDPFLRFFYTYQIIETLMTSDYSSRFLEIKSRFISHQDTSITHLKDFIEEFQKITKEKPRIKSTLQTECPTTNLICENILSNLREDFTKLDFAEKIYKIRNIIFHDFQRIKGMGSQISELEDNLSNYLLNSKLQ